MKLYAVLRHNGEIKRNRMRGLCVYDTPGSAKRVASCDGDSVVEIDVTLDREPIFIRRKVMP